jgi:hypothetical protein
VTSIFTLGSSLNLSSLATRVDKLAYYYTVQELKNLGPCVENYNSYQPHPPGSLLIQSDLKLAEWLSDAVTLAAIGEIGLPTGPSTPLKQNAFSHEVKFDIISSGTVNPAWKLRRFSVDQSGSLLAASRERLHDLTIIFGPIDPALKDTLAPTAQSLFVTSQIGTAFSNSLRSSVLP